MVEADSVLKLARYLTHSALPCALLPSMSLIPELRSRDARPRESLSELDAATWRRFWLLGLTSPYGTAEVTRLRARLRRAKRSTQTDLTILFDSVQKTCAPVRSLQ
jgi:hypothetical protein